MKKRGKRVIKSTSNLHFRNDNKLLKYKFSQVSIFIIIAILIVAILIIFFFALRGNIPDSSEKLFTTEINSIDSSLEECLYENGVLTLWTIGLQGGKINLTEPFVKTNLSYVSYGYYLGQKTLSSKDKIETESNSFINALMKLCLNKLDFPAMNITVGNPRVTTKIKTDSVDFYLKFPLTLRKGERSYRMNSEYKKEVPIRFGEVYSIAELIIDKEIKQPNSIDLSYLSGLDYDINIIPISVGTLIYSITDYNSTINNIPYSFVFATKTRK